MRKSIPAWILALVLLFAYAVIPGAGVAEEDEFFEFDEEDYDFGDEDEFFDDLEDQSEEDFKQQVQNISAASGYDNPDLKYDGDYAYVVSEDGEYCVTCLYQGVDPEAVIPDTLGGYPVRAIGDHTFENNGFLTKVVIPEGVTEIGKQAFFMCINLKSVTIPEGVLSIGDQCFAACYVLEDIFIPNSLEFVGEMAFLGCYALEEIEFGTNLKEIGSCAFHTCKVLMYVTVPSRDVIIDETAFVQCPDALEIIYQSRV